MAISGDKLIGLLEQSQLFAKDQLQEFNAMCAGQPDAKPILRALVQNSRLTNYQATLLAANRPGPFVYGDYVLQNRVDSDSLKTLFDASHRPSGHPVRVEFFRLGANVAQDRLSEQVAAVHGHNAVQNVNLTECFELIAQPEHKFHVLEFVASPTLKEFVDANGVVEPARALKWLNQILTGLKALHENQLTQGNLTPADILITNGSAVVLRQPLRNSAPLPNQNAKEKPTQRSLMLIGHAAPERLNKHTPSTPASDIYALGNLVNYMLLGKPFHDANDLRELRERTLHPQKGMLDPIAKTHRPLAVLASKVLAKSPTTRPSASDLSKALQPLLNESTTPAPMTPAPVTLGRFFDAIGRKPPAPVPVIDAPKIVDAPEAVVAAPRITAMAQTRHTRRSDRWVLPVAGVVTLIAAAWLGKGLFRPIEPPEPPEPPSTVATTKATTANDNTTDVPTDPLPNDDTTLSRYDVQPDDGRLPWTPTTNGAPFDLTFVPDTSQLIVSFRPASLHASDEGRLILQSLGPAFARLTQQLENQFGIELKNVEHIVSAAATRSDGSASWVSDIYALNSEAVPDPWNANGQATEGGRLITTGDSVVFRPTGQDNRAIIGSAIAIEAIIGRTAEPVLRREFQTLHTASDSDAQFSILFAPNYILRDGRSLIASDYEAFPKIVDEFFGDGVQAALFTTHVDQQQTFAELNIAATVEASRSLPVQLPTKLNRLGELIENYIAGLDQLNPYWRSLALRYDNMAQLLTQQTRMGVEGKRLVVNASLPPKAAHNLLLATELAIVAGRGQLSSKEPVAPKIATLQELFTQRMSLNIPQQSLEFSIRDLTTEVNESFKGLEFPFQVDIVGADLELEGITRNQQIRDFKVDNRPINEVLTALILKANPTANAAANTSDQKLVWVVKPSSEMNKPVVLITTRKAAETKGYALPEVFQP